MKPFTLVCPVCLLLATGLAIHAADNDPIRKKLDAARAEYKDKMEKFNKAVADHFDAKEKDAVRDSDKKLLSQVRADRQLFEDQGELPQAAPAELKQRLTDIRTPMIAAYKTALNEYARSAALIEDELDAFLAISDPAAKVVAKLVATQWVHADRWVYNFKRDRTYSLEGTRRGGKYEVSKDCRLVTLYWEGENQTSIIHIGSADDNWLMVDKSFAPRAKK